MATLRQRVDDYLVQNSQRWIALGKQLEQMPELGFRERKTTRFAQEYIKDCGVHTIQTQAITGFIARLPGPDAHEVALMAELDAIACPNHPNACAQSGAAHACGHNMQLTALLAVCRVFTELGIGEELAGRLVLLGVPAEEILPAEYLQSLKKQGLSGGKNGKEEFLHAGALEGLDAIVSVHALVNDEDTTDIVMGSPSCNGYHTLQATFLGQAAHAGMAPFKGVNALSAAILAIQGIQVLKESFADEDCIRVAINITEGGNNLSTVPQRAVLRLQARAKTSAALAATVEKLKRACLGASQMLGCTLEMEEERGYQPYQANLVLLSVLEQEAELLLHQSVRRRAHGYYSSDLGEICATVPTAQIVVGGFEGNLHSPNFHVADETLAYVLPARILAATVISLLENGAEKLLQIKEDFNAERESRCL